MLTADSEEAKHFRNSIRSYNNAFAFTSFGGKIDASINQGNAPYVFKVGGQIYHQHGTLLPDTGPPRYAQLYFHDGAEATWHRQSLNTSLRGPILLDLHHMLLESNHLIQHYLSAEEWFRAQPADVCESAHVRLHFDAAKDRHRYNLPTGNDEVAVILPDPVHLTHAQSDTRDIIIRYRNPVGAQPQDLFHRIHDGSPLYVPLHYVLLFPRGELGWTWTMTQEPPGRRAAIRNDDHVDGLDDEGVPPAENDSAKLTRMVWIAWMCFEREGNFSTLLRGGKLFQQWAVDQWATLEQERLQFLQHNQKTLWADLYNGLADAANAADHQHNPRSIGIPVILPSSFIGGARNMFQLCQDSLALGAFYNKIDLFVTITANPKWPEIMDALLPGQTPSDRPDLVARVFNLKVKAILHDIYKLG